MTRNSPPNSQAAPAAPMFLGGHQVNTQPPSSPPPPIASANPANHPPGSPSPWSTGLCDCFDDFFSCCLTVWCPCVTFGRIAEIVDQGTPSCVLSGTLYALLIYLLGCPCILSCCYRSKLRRQFHLEEKPCADCCVHWCCGGCALCQEYRQLMHQGFDMSIGWHGNVARNGRLATSAPTVEGGMSR